LARVAPRGPGGFAVPRSFLWLYMVFDLFMSSGYVAFSGVSDFGDAAVIIAGLFPHGMWRGLLIVIGAVGYYLSMWIAALELRRFISSTHGKRRVQRFLWIPYLAAGVVACGAGALNRTMAPGVALGLAAISSFGAGFGMVWLSDLHCRMVITEPNWYVRRSISWIAAAAAVGATFVFVLGPGLSNEGFEGGLKRKSGLIHPLEQLLAVMGDDGFDFGRPGFNAAVALPYARSLL